MANKVVLREWIVEALSLLGGSGSVLDVSRAIWRIHEEDLRESGDLFFTWQYDIRWAAQELRGEGVLSPVSRTGRRSPWSLAQRGGSTVVSNFSES